MIQNELTVNFLDKTLLYLRANSIYSPSKDTVKEFSEGENRMLIGAMYKLEKDGYAYITKSETPGIQAVTFHISFDGLLALEEKSSFRRRNQPYRNRERIQSIADTKRVVMIIMNIINSLAILYLMYRAIPK